MIEKANTEKFVLYTHACLHYQIVKEKKNFKIHGISSNIFVIIFMFLLSLKFSITTSLI